MTAILHKANEKPQPFQRQLNDEDWNFASPTNLEPKLQFTQSSPYPYRTHLNPSAWTLELDTPITNAVYGSSPASRVLCPISRCTVTAHHLPVARHAASGLAAFASAPVQISHPVPGMSLCLSLSTLDFGHLASVA
ncbi:hypothetical protein CSAL01_05416 [Colletotrichum salicis]|uniref:Uncharacterized protein n=1 Tax=Colletotrichum salicis TaxID=1209931 RepID=A0A135RRZ5_9PEZI|nr:hypothetical protein CSAL01_05416 [Colletotrichum salicis]